MQTTIEAAINTGLLFISTFYGVNTVMFDRTTDPFVLPSPYAFEREHEIARQIILSAQSKTGCFLRDCALISYCLVIIEDKVLLIGPYRNETLRSFDIPAYLSKNRKIQNEFMNYYKNLPPITEEQIKLVVRTLFVSLFGPEVHSHEQIVNMYNYIKGELPSLSETLKIEDSHGSIRNTGMMFYYMEQIRSGNFEKAFGCYKKIMHGRAFTFMLVNIIEGTSRLRTLTAIALHEARVPDTSAEALLDDYKMKIRMTTNITDVRHYSEKMIEQSCALVRSYRANCYSQSIGLAVDYIHRNLSHLLSISEIADVVNLTPNCFSTKFHEEVGIPASAYITKHRMQMAAQLLVYTNLNIKDICTHIGMLDGNYFSRCFKKMYGISPSNFRKRGEIPRS